jgi:hypothetical protein
VAVATDVNDIAVVFAAANTVVITVVAALVVDMSLSCVVVIDVGGAVADVAVVKFVADCAVSDIVVAVRFVVEFDFILNLVVVVLVFNIVVVVFSSVDDVVKVVISVDTLVCNTVLDVVKAIFAVDNPDVVVFSCSVDVVKVVIIAVDTLVGNTFVDVVKANVAVDNPALVVISLVFSLSCSFCSSSLFSNPFSFPSTLVFFSFSSVSFFIFLLTSVSSRLSSPTGPCSSSFLS